MFLRIIGISAKEIPSVGVSAPYHSLITVPSGLRLNLLKCSSTNCAASPSSLNIGVNSCNSFALRLFRPPLTFSKRSSNCCNSSLLSGCFRRLLACKGVPCAVSLSSGYRRNISLPREGSFFTSPLNSTAQTAVCLYFGKENISAVPFAVP